VSRLRLGLGTRLAVAMATIAIAAVALSMALVSEALDHRLDQLAAAHVESSAGRVAAVAGDLYRDEGGWTPSVLAELRERSHLTGLAVGLRDAAGRRLAPAGAAPATARDWAGHAPVRAGGRTVGSVSVRIVREDLFAAENRALHAQLHELRKVCAALAVLLGVLAAAVVATTLVRPVRWLTDAAERMGRGDLAARARAGGGPELEQLADAFNRLASTLAREDELRRATAADIAHELRTPVTGIVSRIEAAQDGVMRDPAANLEAMHAEALRLARLIDDVGQLAEAEQPELLVAKRPLDLAAAGQARAAAYAELFAARDIAFEPRLGPAPVLGDPQRLEQIADNLLSNALRYTDPGGRVVLHVRRRGDRAVLEVSDTGIGIAEDDLPRVFDRFWRSDRSRSRATGGSGIGLAVVRELVRAHQGRVELRSELGRGTTARVVLPSGVPAVRAPAVRATPVWA
jgi:two-component system, OmpR family, sensor histidine kinase BaeS